MCFLTSNEHYFLCLSVKRVSVCLRGLRARLMYCRPTTPTAINACSQVTNEMKNCEEEEKTSIKTRVFFVVSAARVIV